MRELRKNILSVIVALIGVLMLLNIFLIYQNNQTIRINQAKHKQAERLRIYFDQIGKSVIHSLDLGVRAYAIRKNEKLLRPYRDGLAWKDSILSHVEEPLRELGYLSPQFLMLKDSLNDYAMHVTNMVGLLDQNRRSEFEELFAKDRGGWLWGVYLRAEKDVFSFVEETERRTEQRYDRALRNNFILQIVLFCVIIPTLAVTAYHTRKSYTLADKVVAVEYEKNELLREQNEMLEKKVNARTHELASRHQQILSQNEELAAQRDSLELQNIELQQARAIIQRQHSELHERNHSLEEEVSRRTQDLSEANQELINQNSQLEQFAFVSAHNLRAPLARIMGLANVVHFAPSESDRQLALDKLLVASCELDQVVRDLNMILNIKREHEELAPVNLPNAVGRVRLQLSEELQKLQAKLACDFTETATVFAVPSYIESIFYHLISNSLKFHDPMRIPEIRIQTKHEGDYILLNVTDNGLGIDLHRYGHQVFNLYKRFHLHMEGRGLGLYLVKTKMQAMGGKIEIESEPNEGTTIRLLFRRFLI